MCTYTCTHINTHTHTHTHLPARRYVGFTKQKLTGWGERRYMASFWSNLAC